MPIIPFFGSNDDEDEPATKEQVGDITVVSNKDIDVKTVSADDLESSTGSTFGGLNVHTITLDSGTSSPAPSDGGTVAPEPESAGGTTAPEPQQPEAPEPTTTPSPEAKPYSRGTFVVPANRDFLQKLEARGKNGHGEIVETVYVLTGSSYTHPTDLIRLDNPEHYGSATRSSVQFNPHSMARKVANLYSSGETPGLIARFHTHPSGSLTPSSADQSSAPQVRDAFVDAFGTDDFEFFHGIHGLEKHGRNPDPSERQSLEISGDHLSWVGERFRHKLAVFGRGFKSSKDVGIAKEN